MFFVLIDSTTLKDFFSSPKEISSLQLINTPENYLGQNLSLHNVFVTIHLSPGDPRFKIAAPKEDGNWVYIPFIIIIH